MNRPARLLVYLVTVAVFVLATTAWSWQVGTVDLPPAAVRVLGRVAGAVAGQTDVDVKLPVAVHRQEHALSCEVAALKMALSRFGVMVTEAELIAQLPFDRTPKGNGVWGNPNKGFVGNIDGKMLIDGYGVYWDPIASLGQRYKRTEVLRNSTAAAVAEHLAAGRPVIVWGYFGRYKPYEWRDSTGEKVQAVNGEHTRLVTGFKGPVNNPTHFSLIDPIYGELVWTQAKFMENWTSLGRHAVAVYAQPRWIRARDDHRVWEISADGTKRHYVPNWEVFAASGGAPEAIAEVDSAELLKYRVGPDVKDEH